MSPAVLAVTAHAANAMALGEEMVQIPIAFEMVAVIVAAASGVLAARENKLDLIGAIGLAVLVSLGGGLTRDVILQEHNVYILQQPLALPVSIGTAAAVFAFPWMVEKPDRLISVLDIFAVGLFAVMGADKTMAYGYPPITCVMMGFITAVGGGMLRDICLARVPYKMCIRDRGQTVGELVIELPETGVVDAVLAVNRAVPAQIVARGVLRLVLAVLVPAIVDHVGLERAHAGLGELLIHGLERLDDVLVVDKDVYKRQEPACDHPSLTISTRAPSPHSSRRHPR